MIKVEGLMGLIPESARFSSYLSIDPGLTTGICFWDDSGKPTHHNEIHWNYLNQFLDMIYHNCTTLKKIIVEEWVLYQHKALAQSGSHLETVQVIGMVKRVNYQLKLSPVVEVRADNKDIAAQWAGMKVPKGHMPNWMAAYLVGYWWLHSVEKVIPARVLDA